MRAADSIKVDKLKCWMVGEWTNGSMMDWTKCRERVKFAGWNDGSNDLDGRMDQWVGGVVDAESCGSDSGSKDGYIYVGWLDGING